MGSRAHIVKHDVPFPGRWCELCKHDLIANHNVLVLDEEWSSPSLFVGKFLSCIVLHTQPHVMSRLMKSVQTVLKCHRTNKHFPAGESEPWITHWDICNHLWALTSTCWWLLTYSRLIRPFWFPGYFSTHLFHSRLFYEASFRSYLIEFQRKVGQRLMRQAG